VAAAPGLVFAIWLGIAVWAALAGFSGLWLWIGFGVAASPRDLMAVFWSTIGMLPCLGLMVSGAYPPSDWGAGNFLLKEFCTGAAAGLAMRLPVPASRCPARDKVPYHQSLNISMKIAEVISNATAVRLLPTRTFREVFQGCPDLGMRRPRE
jgi:hypothetical protein